MYAEETDWCFRFKARGWKNWFTPDAEIIHFGGASAAKLGVSRAQITNASFIRYTNKHWSKPRAFAGKYLILLFYVTRLAALLPKRMISSSEQDERRLHNHLAGLKDIFAKDRYG